MDIMKFEELMNRITGVSCPIFGISWNPPTSERTIAKQIISHLEMCRVLYSGYDLDYYISQTMRNSVKSVLKIKEFLMNKQEEIIQNSIEEKSPLYKGVILMLIQCNLFLDRCQERTDIRSDYSCVSLESVDIAGFNSYAMPESSIPFLTFKSALEMLRDRMGLEIGRIALSYGLPVGDELAKIVH